MVKLGRNQGVAKLTLLNAVQNRRTAPSGGGRSKRESLPAFWPATARLTTFRGWFVLTAPGKRPRKKKWRIDCDGRTVGRETKSWTDDHRNSGS